MPSSLPSDDSARSLIPPTPESDITNSPHTPQFEDRSSPNFAHEDQPVITQKRKAGRKPLYKTAQERRDRNRRAQLAFRARRSDYLARLEETCRSLENVVVELQESNRTANDALTRERVKVRYLERLLQTSCQPTPSFSASPQLAVNFPIPPTDNVIMSSSKQGVSFPLNLQLQSLTTLEQQISSTNSTPQVRQPRDAMSQLLFPESYLGQSLGFNNPGASQSMVDSQFEGLQASNSSALENIKYDNSPSSPSPSNPYATAESGFPGYLNLPSLARGCGKRLVTGAQGK